MHVHLPFPTPACPPHMPPNRFYFSDGNLSRDSFMRGKLGEDDGWVSLSMLLTFNRMKKMGLDVAQVAEALGGSGVLEVDHGGGRVRRRVAYEMSDE